MDQPQEERKAQGRRLAAARKEAGYTLESAAEALRARGYQVVRATIGAWETGRNMPSLLWLRRLAALYRQTVESLVGSSLSEQWPFTPELYQKILTASDDELHRAENILRAAFGMNQMIVVEGSRRNDLITPEDATDVHHAAQEDGSGWPEQHQVPEPTEDGTHQGYRERALPKNRGGA